MKDIFLLDMDDTLLDFGHAEEVNFLKTLRQFGISADRSTYLRFHEINAALWRALERGEITRERLKVRRFAELFDECGITVDAGAAAQAYWENFPFVCFPFEGSQDFLKRLKERGRVYIVTNGGAVIQKQHILDAGFTPYLDGVFISEEVGHDKPSKEYADHVRANIPDFELSRAVWVGDSLTSDRACAKAMGVDFILFAPHGKPEGYEDLCAENYEEIEYILSK